MLNRRMTVVGMVIVVGLVVAALPEAAKPSDNPKCAVAFADRPGDAVRSDGRGAYLNGLDSVECQIWSGGSEDATLRRGKNTTRRFSVDYRNLAQALAPNSPVGVTTDGWFLNIHSIGTMEVGESTVSKAGLQAATDQLLFRWCGGTVSNCTFGGPDGGSMLVAVTRTTTTTWSVTTDGPLGGDVALLLQPSKGSYTARGLYHLPFTLEISCPTCQ